jgi:hypothetical protein
MLFLYVHIEILHAIKSFVSGAERLDDSKQNVRKYRPGKVRA